MPSNNGMTTLVGFYATVIFLKDGDLAIVANHNLMKEWAEYSLFSSKHRPGEANPRELKLGTTGSFLSLESLLEDLREQNLLTVLSDHDLSDIGALTSGPVIAVDIERDDDYKITKIGKTWWFSQYQVECEIETLIEHGIVVIPKAPS